MTRFEREFEAARKDATEADLILRERKAELDALWEKGKAEKNGFRRQCIAQEYARRKAEYDKISELI